jgi:hypothetical protein
MGGLMKVTVLQANLRKNETDTTVVELIVKTEDNKILEFDSIALLPKDEEIMQNFMDGVYDECEEPCIPEQKLFFDLTEAAGVDNLEPKKVFDGFWVMPKFTGKEIEIEVVDDFICKIEKIS